ncbi:immune inhibitor A domain-containing protein [Myceligenerans indicum]|uniref:M6 family metalloprotease domain-containing protein n=1 Tax=Myceligenerans indicum TaxID=2593663 RepID=A0ABS1LIM9_9MICO|nr:immune inhibitor A domain-containing protein [Myceligenerans indicum]MBL0886100.1 M6 family metalloprotease domain-containing protein [Myceligenerans indicum]
MNPRISAVGAGAALLLTGALVPATAVAAPSAAEPDPATLAQQREDDRPDALAQKQRERKQEAVEMVATGEAKVTTRGKGSKKSRVVKIAPHEYVEYGAQETSQLFSILVDFGDGEGSPYFPDAPAGPMHNELPEPGADDNTTYWTSDFSRDHYTDMFFDGNENGESFHDVYDEMSSGRFDLQGDVSDWVTVPHSEAYYGGGSAAGDETGASMTAFIQDAANAWYDEQIASGKTHDEIVAYLQSFDIWDRYDVDGDGIINEPDGYIDHFQAIHAGEGEEAGAPPWAIWSHRWAVNQGGLWEDGPADYPKLGGIKIGDTDIWIRDYTTEPENGGLGVFAHEFGHDLGLPDYYDTSGGENGTGFWNLMSSGSWMGHGDEDGYIGGTPNHMGATEKMFLGWLDYETVEADESGIVRLGPSFHATTRAQAALVNLPDGSESVDVGVEPIDGNYAYSTTGNNLNTTFASPEFVVPAGGQLSAQVNYEIEEGYDYAFVDITTDGGATWTALSTSESSDEDPNGTNPGGGIDGSSGGWVELTADLSAYAGENAQLRFRYTSDGGVAERAMVVDSVSVGDALSEDFEDASDWTGDWQVATDGKYDVTFSHYYLAENRVYGGYDATLKTGPYNFGWAQSNPNQVEHFPYQDGLLVWYANGLYGDNNTSQHPGGGQALPVDSDATPLTFSDGAIARNRIQVYDATFGTQRKDRLFLHSEAGEAPATLRTPWWSRQSRTFDDTDPYAYWDESNPGNSTIVGGTGTSITVLWQDSRNGHMTIAVNRS